MNTIKFTSLATRDRDPEIAEIIEQEQKRQLTGINLIASENYVSQAVMEATGSVLTNKYAEGYPGKRYYGGCEIVDKAEILAIERCKQLFGAEHVNVQPNAGSPANLAAYNAIIKPGDTILAMSLSSGGHLTHGHPVNFSGMLYKVCHYNVHPETELIDYDKVQEFALQHKPKLIVAGASAYSRFIDFEKFAQIAKSVDAYFMADIAHIAGLISADLHPSPILHADIVTSTTHKTLRGPRGGLIMCKAKHAEAVDRSIMPGLQGGPFMNVIAAKAVCFKEALQPDFKTYQQQIIDNAKIMAKTFQELGYRIVSGGTDNHMFVLDLRPQKITGRAAEVALEKSGISISRSTIPYDTEKPWITSGIRIGTPAITTRGCTVEQAKSIAHIIDEILKNINNEQKLEIIRSVVPNILKQI